MKFSAAILFVMVGLTAHATAAETLACPDPATASQVGACPTEKDLQYTYRGYCSDNARMYDKGDDCVSFERYVELKNTALWETSDGRFDGYLSCAPGHAGIKSAKVRGIKLSQQGSVTRIACDYGNGMVLTHRTKARCKVDAAACAKDAAQCVATCE